MIKAEISNSEIAKLQVDLFLLRDKAGKNFNDRVTRRFGKRGAGKILKDEIREKHTIKAGKVYDTISARKTGTRFNGGVKVNARSRQKGIEQFKTSPRRVLPTRRIGNLKTETEKGKSTKIDGVFTAPLRQQPQNVFYKRIGKARLPLKRIVGPSLFVMYRRSQQRINQRFERGFVDEAIKSVEAIKRRMAK